MNPIRTSLASSARFHARWSRSFSSAIDHAPTTTPFDPPPVPTARGNALQEALDANGARQTWTREEIAEIYNSSLMDLQHAAGTIHRRYHQPGAVQLCTLMNIKTGGCSEDCSYCAQSSKYNTGLKASKMVTVKSVLEAAQIAKNNGSSRFCMGAAWRDMRGRKANLRAVKEMVQGVRELGMEACVTLGMIDKYQAQELKEAGLTAYNHNVDTSREHYPNVITTRTYDERLETIKNVREAGINVCSGGILGLGEQAKDHVGLIHTVATMPTHPESFPVNALVPIKGTPLGDKLAAEAEAEGAENGVMKESVPFANIVRTIATARLVMPKTIIRLAAGRISLSEEKQMICFMSGANAIFTGEKMLTTDCNDWSEDKAMFERWGLFPMAGRPSPESEVPVAQRIGNGLQDVPAYSWSEVKEQAAQPSAPAL